MTETEKVIRVQTLLMGDADATADTVSQYLSIAEDTVKNAMYPYGTPDDFVIPLRYESIQCELAARYFARRGALGEVAHNENTVSRTYASADDADLIRKIVPHAKVV